MSKTVAQRPPRPVSVPLSALDRVALVELAAKVSGADHAAAQARSEQNELWRKLIQRGVPKAAIAEASEISATAINMRLAAPPSRVNRGAGNARGK